MPSDRMEPLNDSRRGRSLASKRPVSGLEEARNPEKTAELARSQIEPLFNSRERCGCYINRRGPRCDKRGTIAMKAGRMAMGGEEVTIMMCPEHAVDWAERHAMSERDLARLAWQIGHAEQ
jgi:hypothetical protein